MITTLLLTLSLLWSSCQATGLRGPSRQLNLLTDTTTNNNVDCSKELNLDIVCQGDCNFTAREGTCESKMFQYHGGPCRAANAANSDSAADCSDLHKGPPSLPGQDVYVVIADAVDPSKNSSMWVQVGGFFWTDYRDYPIGLGLSDTQNITFFSSNETTYDNMLQTMLFYAPCEGTPLHHLASDQSVQLFATAVDVKIRAHLEFQIQSQTPQHQWQLQSVMVTSSVAPHHQELIGGGMLQPTVLVGNNASFPLVMEMHRDDTLSLMSSAKLVAASGLECTINGFYTSAVLPAPTASQRTPTAASKAWP